MQCRRRSTSISQVPTGVIADVFSRRLAVIAGVFAIGAGFLLEGSVPHFPAIPLAQVFWGLGATFTDGAEQAWIAGEVGEDNVGPIFVRSTQIGLIGGLVGAFISVGLASIRLNLPVVVGGALMIVLAVFLLLFMPERGFRFSWKIALDISRDSQVYLTKGKHTDEPIQKNMCREKSALIKRGGGKRPFEARQPPCKVAGKVPIPAEVIPRDEGNSSVALTPTRGVFLLPAHSVL